MDVTPNSLFVFPETGATVRAGMIDGNPWFVASDVRAAIGRGRGGGEFDRLAADEKRVVSEWGNSTLKGHGQVIISESGLYKYVMRSGKAAARPFQDWVTRDVLPAIRKDGAYVRGEELLKPGVVETLDMNDLDALRDRIESLMQRKAAAEKARPRRRQIVGPTTENPAIRFRIDERRCAPLFIQSYSRTEPPCPFRLPIPPCPSAPPMKTALTWQPSPKPCARPRVATS